MAEKKNSKSEENQNDITFEQALERLNVIADSLENQNPSLKEALAMYEEGAFLLKECAEQLKDAESKIKLLSKDSE